jgi:hypothetical protein
MAEDNKAVKLVVFMEPQEKEDFKERGTFCCNPESTAADIEKFCKEKRRLRYSRSFVSMAVLRLHENPCLSGAAIYAFENQRGLSPLDYAILDQTPELLVSVDLVGDDDLKQILTRIAKLWANHDQYESMMHRVQDLSCFPPELRPRELHDWTGRRGPHGYSEARLNRPLKWQEVVQWGVCDKGIGEEPGDRNPGEEIADYFKQ